jgi:hypothetical protein
LIIGSFIKSGVARLDKTPKGNYSAASFYKAVDDRFYSGLAQGLQQELQ